MPAQIRKFLILISIILACLTLWELAGFYASPNVSLVLPRPSSILNRLYTKPDRFLHHTLVTFKEMAAGILLAGAVAFPVAWLMSRLKNAGAAVQSLFVIIQCIPMFTLAPIMVLWLGWSTMAIIIPTSLMLFFPLAITLYQGVHSTPQPLIDFFQLHNATPWQRFVKLEFPHAKTHLLAGLRIAAAGAGVGAVAAEWAGAQEGLGVLMLESRRATDLQTTFGALFCLAAVSLSFYLSVSYKRFAIPSLCVLLFFMPGTAVPQKKATLSLDWLPNANHIPIYAGIEQGYFEEAGIPLQIVKMQDPSGTLGYVATEQVDFGIFYSPDTLRAIENGLPIEVVSTLIPIPLNSLIYRADKPIENILDLRSKVLGYCVDGSHLNFMEELLAAQGLQNMARYNASFDLVSTIASRRVDALYGAYWNIECEHLSALGVPTYYIPLSEFGCPNYPELVVIAKKGNDSERFRVAFEKSIQYAKAQPNEAFAAYKKANPDKDETTLFWEERAWNKTHPLLTTSVLDTKNLEELRNWMKNRNLLQ